MKHYSRPLQAALCGLLALLSTTGTGCRRKPAATPAPPPPAEEPSAAQAQPVAPPSPGSPAPVRAPAVDPAAQAAEERTHAENLRFLNQMLREFVAQNKRFPASFKELENAKVDSPRKAPPGKRWELDATTRTVILVTK